MSMGGESGYHGVAQDDPDFNDADGRGCRGVIEPEPPSAI